MKIKIIRHQSVVDTNRVHPLNNGLSRERGSRVFISFLWHFFAVDNILKLFQVKAALASVFPLNIWAPLSPRPHILEFAAADAFRKDFHHEAFKFFCCNEFK